MDSKINHAGVCPQARSRGEHITTGLGKTFLQGCFLAALVQLTWASSSQPLPGCWHGLPAARSSAKELEEATLLPPKAQDEQDGGKGRTPKGPRTWVKTQAPVLQPSGTPQCPPIFLSPPSARDACGAARQLHRLGYREAEAAA